MNNKTSITSIIFFLSFIVAGDIGGYSIFEYNNTAFEINRVYFQYTDDISNDLFLKIRYDVARDGQGEGGGKFVAYLKNAYVDWSCKECPHLYGGVFSFGLIGTNSYGIQESTWGYRFIAKSPLDNNGFTNTADLGIGYSQSFGNFNINTQILNGEGYKSEQSDNNMATYLRVMYGESQLNKNDGYNIGFVMTNSKIGVEGGPDDDTNLVGLFGGWASNNLRLGLEYNQYEWNTGSGENEENLTSLYANYSITETLDVFVRNDAFDYKDESDDLQKLTTSWIGVVCNPSKGLYISPNVMIADGNNDYSLTFMFKY